ncbi:MAG: DUF1801 domain-containing protein [Chloroflexales bacterium]|nr:DUF1801 domain-containing protein [Chloroflexales bacterium]
MPAKKADARLIASGQPTEVVDTFLANLDHPFNQEVRAVRQIILEADARISEGIKWNAPSFFTTEHFATFNLHAKDGVQLVFHRGAKVRDTPSERIAIADPMGLLAWRSPDRALATFRELSDVNAKRAALADIVRAWIAYV